MESFSRKMRKRHLKVFRRLLVFITKALKVFREKPLSRFTLIEQYGEEKKTECQFCEFSLLVPAHFGTFELSFGLIKITALLHLGVIIWTIFIDTSANPNVDLFIVFTVFLTVCHIENIGYVYLSCRILLLYLVLLFNYY